MGSLVWFFLHGIREVFRGSWLYWCWLAFLLALVGVGVYFYRLQFESGLIVTGMSDQVSWGAYIANFTYLVGVAAAAVMLVIPAYIFDRQDLKHIVLIGEGVAVAAVTMCILFVTADLGQPLRMWHLLPMVGKMNFPSSLLVWDVIVLSGYLLLNVSIPFYILFSRYRGNEPKLAIYFPGVLISIVWAISIHTVTAFLFSSNVARPFWHTAVLGPRFLASAFTAGPALIVIALQFINRFTPFKVARAPIDFLGLVITIALQINLFLLGVEFFNEFYDPAEEAVHAQYLFFGVRGHHALVPWIWTAIGLNTCAVIILSIHKLRQRLPFLLTACGLAIVGVWIEKGMGLVIPGFTPTPIGEFFGYTPSRVEIFVSLGIWALGFLIFTVLTKVAIPMELGNLVYKGKSGTQASASTSH